MFTQRHIINRGGFPEGRRLSNRQNNPAGVDLNQPFVAIDFETASEALDSACAVALVRVEGNSIVQRSHTLLRPPCSYFAFSHVHGITWEKVQGQPVFSQAWPSLQRILEGAAFLAAHNSSFDSSVLRACCAGARLPVPAQHFLCTALLARRVWRIHPTRLPDVCARLGITLTHHDPCSDAEACARIILAARSRLNESLSTTSA
jgi:DNA polymerase-3 subunit epsilon